MRRNGKKRKENKHDRKLNAQREETRRGRWGRRRPYESWEVFWLLKQRRDIRRNPYGTGHANTQFPSTTFELRLPLDRRQGDRRIERGIRLRDRFYRSVFCNSGPKIVQLKRNFIHIIVISVSFNEHWKLKYCVALLGFVFCFYWWQIPYRILMLLFFILFIRRHCTRLIWRGSFKRIIFQFNVSPAETHSNRANEFLFSHLRSTIVNTNHVSIITILERVVRNYPWLSYNQEYRGNSINQRLLSSTRRNYLSSTTSHNPQAIIMTSQEWKGRKGKIKSPIN